MRWAEGLLLCSSPLHLDLGVTNLDDSALINMTAVLSSKRQQHQDAAPGTHACGLADAVGTGPRTGSPACHAVEPAIELRALQAAFGHLAVKSQDTAAFQSEGPHQQGPLAALLLDSCSRVTCASLLGLAHVHLLRDLKVLSLSGLSCLGSGPCSPTALSTAADTLSSLLNATRQLQDVFLDELIVSERVCEVVARRCCSLRQASLMACKGLTDAGLAAIAQGCPDLRHLSIGGAASPWSEHKGLATFTQLSSLSLARRPMCTDSALVGLMGSLGQLQELRLASLSRITDTGMAAVPESVTALMLVCCDNVRGASLARLSRLRELRMRHCPAILAQHLQVRS